MPILPTPSQRAHLAQRRALSVIVSLNLCNQVMHHFKKSLIRRYPLEYFFLGWKPSADNLIGTTTIADKLNTVHDGESMQLFIWKLHNAVSSSVERGEVLESKKPDVSMLTSFFSTRIGIMPWSSSILQDIGQTSTPNSTGRLSTLAAFPQFDCRKWLRCTRWWCSLWISWACYSDLSYLFSIVTTWKAALKLAPLRAGVLAVDVTNFEDMIATVEPLLAHLDKAILESGLLHEVGEAENKGFFRIKISSILAPGIYGTSWIAFLVRYTASRPGW